MLHLHHCIYFADCVEKKKDASSFVFVISHHIHQVPKRTMSNKKTTIKIVLNRPHYPDFIW